MGAGAARPSRTITEHDRHVLNLKASREKMQKLIKKIEQYVFSFRQSCTVQLCISILTFFLNLLFLKVR
jgi:chromatin segregation and condensation protein Rec8/ScpA/Scc1 (kleisin family)